ncbi:SagB family peptide dehydrogenase [Streptomyces goshikiensis]|uniref:SagB family peptide dehydrogenase n=1 Tax=Streptomyces goshikiensis TaxID=1942 RepID=UPI0036DCF20F
MLISHLAPPRITELWALRDDTHLDVDSDPGGAVLLDSRWGELRLPEPGDTLREVLRRMSTGPVSLRNVLPDFPEFPEFPGLGGPAGPGPYDPGPYSPGTTALLAALSRLQHLVVRILAVGTAPLLSVVPLSEHAVLAPRPLPYGRPCRLSRFTVLRYADGGLRMESPLSQHRVELLRPEAALLLGRLSGGDPGRAWPGAEENPALPEEAVRAALAYLAATGMAVIADPADPADPAAATDPGAGAAPTAPAGEVAGNAPRFAEDRDPALLPWSADDLLLHSRSRLGRHDGDCGETYAHTDRIPAEPVVCPPPSDTSGIPLFRPDLDELVRTDPPFAAVLEGRSLPPRCDAGELTAHEVGSLLYRAARVRSVRPPGRYDPEGYAHSDRPYPSIADTYALELYLLVSDCTWLAPGAYHYNPLDHCLERVDSAPEALAKLTVNAQTAANLLGPPPLLITITARFSRSSYKLSGIAYTSILKDVGALQQTLALVATALGLGSRALAIGDADAAVRALGLDWRRESSVGDFVIGPVSAAENGGSAPVKADPPRCAVGLNR